MGVILSGIDGSEWMNVNDVRRGALFLSLRDKLNTRSCAINFLYQ